MREHSTKSELVAAADMNPEFMNQVEGIARYADAREMMAKERLDAVYIATLVETHGPLALAAFEAGLHVVSEKPMAESAKVCRAMVDGARKAGRCLAVTFENRYHPHHRTIRRWIDAGYLGTIQAIHVQEFWDGHKTFGPLSERRARLMQRSGGLDCGIHRLDLVRYFCEGNWKTLHALGAWFGEAMEKPPHIGILGRLDNGVLVTVNASMGYAASIEPRPMNEILVIAGTKGVVSLAIDEPTPDAFVHTAARVRISSERLCETIPIVELDHPKAIGMLLDDFAGLIEGSKSSPPELAMGEDGLAAQIATEWANDSAVADRKNCHDRY